MSVENEARVMQIWKRDKTATREQTFFFIT